MRIKNNNETVKISEAFHLLAAASIEATRLVYIFIYLFIFGKEKKKPKIN